MAGSQDFAADPRNAKALLYLNGDLVPRSEARVSIFDAGFVLGDGVWEGLRLHKGRLLFLEEHLDRLYAGLDTIALDIGLTRDELTAEIRRHSLARSELRTATNRILVYISWLLGPIVLVVIGDAGISSPAAKPCSPSRLYSTRSRSGACMRSTQR